MTEHVVLVAGSKLISIELTSMDQDDNILAHIVTTFAETMDLSSVLVCTVHAFECSRRQCKTYMIPILEGLVGRMYFIPVQSRGADDRLTFEDVVCESY